MKFEGYQPTNLFFGPTTALLEASACDSKNIMSDLVEIPAFDVEAQQGLLQGSTPADDQAKLTQVVSQVENAGIAICSAMRTLIVLVSSTERFKWGANNSSDIDSSKTNGYTASYTALPINDDEHKINLLIDDEGGKNAEAEPLNGGLSALNPEAEKDNTETRNISEQLDVQKVSSSGVGTVAVAGDLETELRQANTSMLFRSFLGSYPTNCTIILLLIAAILSLTFGIIQQGLATGWVDGGIVVFTILFLVISKSIREYFKMKSCHGLLMTNWLSRSNVQFIGEGNQLVTSPSSDLRDGDLVLLRKGCLVPADGTCERGVSLEVDGEFKHEMDEEGNSRLFHGSKVIRGNAPMRVTSVGIDTMWGGMMKKAISSPNKICKFEDCLNKVNTFVQFVGLLIGILISIALFLRYSLKKPSYGNALKPDPKGEPTSVATIMEILKGIISGSKSSCTTRVLTLLSISLVGVVEGIPVVISLAVFKWNRSTLKHDACESDHLACVKMASLTTILYTDKLGGLTEHEYDIDKFLIGGHLMNESSEIAPVVLECLCDGVRTFMRPLTPNNCESIVGSLISWAKTKIGLREGSLNEKCKRITRNSLLGEFCGVLMEKDAPRGSKMIYSHWNGPPREILSLCSYYYDPKGEKHDICTLKREMIECAIEDSQAEQEIMIALAYKTITCESDESNDKLILLGMIGFKHRKPEETRKSILALKKGGIRTILALGDGVQPDDKICSMLSPDSNSDNLDHVIPAETFRAWTEDQKKARIGSISVIWNCHLSDKIDFLRLLQKDSQVVAVLGHRTLDSPLLKEADIGMTVGNWSSIFAREVSDIHISAKGELNFIVDVIEKARCFHENIGRNFIQIQLIIGISSSLINFFGTVLCGDAPLTVIQLLWLNLIVGLVGGFVVITVHGTKGLNDILPITTCGLLITKSMWRNIVIQALYQASVFVILVNKGEAILGVSAASVRSLIYKGFCFCQILVTFNCREPEAFNIFRGLLQSDGKYFFGAITLLITFQATFFVAETHLYGVPWLSWIELGVCLAIGVVSCLVDFVGKCVWRSYVCGI